MLFSSNLLSSGDHDPARPGAYGERPAHIPMLKAVFFDFNGVLVDDEHIHMELFQDVLAGLDIDLSEEDYFDKYFGYSDRDLLRVISEERGVKLKKGRVDDLIRRKNKSYLEVVAQRPVLFAGARDAVESFAEAYPLGIVSGALRVEIETILKSEDLDGQFRFVVAAEDVERGKPDPEGYVIALDRANGVAELDQLPVNPSECLVIEDSPAGVDAARALGMKIVAIASSVPRSQLVEADLVYDSIDQIRMDRIRSLFGDPIDPAVSGA